jgi:hypothetical protein
VTFGKWIRDTASHVRKGNVTGLQNSAYQLYVGGLRRTGRIYNYGTPIFEDEWDLLIVLDACRPDLVEAVSEEYPFLDGETTMSVGSATEEWMAKNFDEQYADEMADTVYVTGNPHSSKKREGDPFRHLEAVWQHSWDDEAGTVRAETVTEYAIAAGREFDASRHIVHYMQPHHPFVPTPELNEGIGFEADEPFDHIWQKLRHDAVSCESVWSAYIENLRYVLDSVSILLQNFDAETAIITSDHGNAMGEYGVYGHPMYVPLAALKRVPYCRTSAEDTGEFEPDCQPTQTADVEGEVTERLGDLGYV